MFTGLIFLPEQLTGDKKIMTTEVFFIEKMSCQHCVMAIKKELSKLELETCEVQIGSAKVNYDETKVSSELIENAIREAGYNVKKD